ncbi:MAG: GDP-L-fucose synthase [Patescibacteria group bacterium]
MKSDSKIFVCGHKGMVGSGIWKELEHQGYTNLVGKTHTELDLLDSVAVKNFFEVEKPEYVILAAAKVGGIHANDTYPAEFIYQNLQIQNNIIHSAYMNNVKKLLFLGSSCIYPRDAAQPITEDSLLTGPLEKTNQWYAVAKISGIKMCEAYRKQYGVDYISVMPTNLYGINDTYSAENSHVIPGLIRRFHEAKVEGKPAVQCWGDGSAFREFLYSQDLAKACVFLMKEYSEAQHINVGYGSDVMVKDLANLVKEIVGYEGEIEWDTTKPNGTPKKLMDSSKIFNLGWKPTIGLREGLELAYEDFKKKQL